MPQGYKAKLLLDEAKNAVVCIDSFLIEKEESEKELALLHQDALDEACSRSFEEKVNHFDEGDWESDWERRCREQLEELHLLDCDSGLYDFSEDESDYGCVDWCSSGFYDVEYVFELVNLESE